MPLTDTRIRNTKVALKPIKITDARGLYIEIRPTGAKLWRYRYRIGSKENVFAIGEYPDVNLADARQARDDARKLVKRGIHPAHDRSARTAEQIAAGANTFECVAKEWLAKRERDWTPKNYARMNSALEREVFPQIGRLPIRSVTPAHILQIIRRVDEAGAPTVAILIRQWCFRIFNHAIATLRADSNPAAGEIRNAVTPPPTKNHPPLTRTEIPGLLTAVGGYGGEQTTKIALLLLLHTFVRSAELRGAEWTEFDLARAEWRIPATRMKMRSPHIVPLSTQAVDLLRGLQKLTGNQKYLFPNSRTPGSYMASTTLNAALVRLGCKGRFSPHGFRATASTMLNEMGFNSDWIERQLAHKARGVRAVYNRAEYLTERQRMMQQWSDMLAALAEGAQVIPLYRRA